MIYDEKLKAEAPKKKKRDTSSSSPLRGDASPFSRRASRNSSILLSSFSGQSPTKLRKSALARKTMRQSSLGTDKPAVVSGWSQMSFSVAKILGSIIGMTVEYFNCGVILREKNKKIKEIINLSVEIMEVKTLSKLAKLIKN